MVTLEKTMRALLLATCRPPPQSPAHPWNETPRRIGWKLSDELWQVECVGLASSAACVFYYKQMFAAACIPAAFFMVVHLRSLLKRVSLVCLAFMNQFLFLPAWLFVFLSVRLSVRLLAVCQTRLQV